MATPTITSIAITTTTDKNTDNDMYEPPKGKSLPLTSIKFVLFYQPQDLEDKSDFRVWD